ncbi:hypothetical protein BDR07DRAFT_73938 [Suillus spraguei]|nr:hypothetical protein BDR07DRAFT_73938 [Suillus spraguei]
MCFVHFHYFLLRLPHFGAWGLFPFFFFFFVSMGSWVGIRYFFSGTRFVTGQAAACITFVFSIPCLLPSIYHSLQIWLMGVHLLSANVRFCALTW